MLHKFQVGQMVRYGGSFARAHLIAGSYEVVGQLPARDGANQYRIKSAGDAHQRIANEQELQPERAAAAASALFKPRA